MRVVHTRGRSWQQLEPRTRRSGMPRGGSAFRTCSPNRGCSRSRSTSWSLIGSRLPNSMRASRWSSNVTAHLFSTPPIKSTATTNREIQTQINTTRRMQPCLKILTLMGILFRKTPSTNQGRVFWAKSAERKSTATSIVITWWIRNYQGSPKNPCLLNRWFHWTLIIAW